MMIFISFLLEDVKRVCHKELLDYLRNEQTHEILRQGG